MIYHVYVTLKACSKLENIYKQERTHPEKFRGSILHSFENKS